MKTSILTIIAALCVAQIATATVSFQIKAESLNTSAGVAAPTSTLAYLVADTNNNGFGPVSAGSSTTVGSFANGVDDQILAKFDLSTFATAGVLSTTVTGITVPVGTPLALYWFPTLTISSSTVAGGTSYGTYNSASAIDGSSAWIAPANGTTNYKTFFYTSSASILHTGGTNAATLGNASLTVAAVPEPSRVMLLGLGLGAFIVRRRRNA